MACACCELSNLARKDPSFLRKVKSDDEFTTEAFRHQACVQHEGSFKHLAFGWKPQVASVGFIISWFCFIAYCDIVPQLGMQETRSCSLQIGLYLDSLRLFLHAYFNVNLSSKVVSLRIVSGQLKAPYYLLDPNSCVNTTIEYRRWRFVINGAIDGYSRMVVFLNDTNNNRARTVLRAFLSAVRKCGLPDKAR